MGALRAAFEATVSESELIKPLDAVLVEHGRFLCDRLEMGDEDSKTYSAQLAAVYRDLMATPLARHSAGIDKQSAGIGKLARLRAVSNGVG